MKLNRQAADLLADEMELLLPHLPEQALVPWTENRGMQAVRPAVAIAVAIQVVEQLAQESRMSFDAACSVIQLGRFSSVSLEDQGFENTFPNVAQGEADEVRDYVLDEMKTFFAREILDDQGCDGTIKKIIEYALMESEKDISVPGQRIAPMNASTYLPTIASAAKAEAASRAMIQVMDGAGIEPAKGMAALYYHGASFGSATPVIDSVLQQRLPGLTRADREAQAASLQDYLSRHSQNLVQGVLTDMGQQWLDENEQRIIEQAKAELGIEGELPVQPALSQVQPQRLICQETVEDRRDEDSFSFDDFSMDR